MQKTIECRWDRSVLVNVDPDGRTLYKGVLASNAITITKVGF